MSKRLNLRDIKIIIDNRGGKLLTDNYINNHQKLDVICENGHNWNPTSKSLLKGGWCSICYNQTESRRKVKAQPNKILEAHHIALSHGGVCLSSEYINNNSKLHFRCAANHEWHTNFKCISSRKSWCPECNDRTFTTNKLIKAIAKAHAIAKDRGGKVVTENISNLKNKIKWQCSLNHEWTATFQNVIYNNSWCPQCNRLYNFSENVCRKYFEHVFQTEFPSVRPKWLLSPKNKPLELDGYSEKLGIAFEHQGLQHYENVEHFANTQDIVIRDKAKVTQCICNNVKLIIIPDLLSKTKIENLHIYLKNQFDELNICYNESRLVGVRSIVDLNGVKNIDRKKEYKNICNIAIKNGGKCLSNKFVNRLEKMEFTCFNNHIFKSAPDSIKNGSWCSYCVIDEKRLSINDSHTLAQTKGGICLSTEYINNHTKLKWQCGSCDNIFESTYNAVQNGNWCPPCSIKRRANKRRIDISLYKLAAENKGGKCLSKTVESCYDKLEFECEKKHIWFGRADQIKNTKQWCPICAIEKKLKINKI